MILDATRIMPGAAPPLEDLRRRLIEHTALPNLQLERLPFAEGLPDVHYAATLRHPTEPTRIDSILVEEQGVTVFYRPNILDRLEYLDYALLLMLKRMGVHIHIQIPRRARFPR